MVSYHPAKFGGYRHCTSGDRIILVYHMISHDHMIKESWDFMSKSPSLYITILPSFVAIDNLSRDVNIMA